MNNVLMEQRSTNIATTDRLLIVEATLSDAPFIFELLNSPNWLAFIGDRNIKTLEDAEGYINRALIKSYQDNGYGLFKVMLKKDKLPIGLCGLLKRPNLDHPDIGFAILPPFEGKGYITEAATSILQYALNQLALKEVLAITTENNQGSQKVLQKIGLQQIGHTQLEEGGTDFLLYACNGDKKSD